MNESHGIIDLVGDSRSQLPNGRHFFLLEDLALQLLDFTQVLENRHRALNVPTLLTQWRARDPDGNHRAIGQGEHHLPPLGVRAVLKRPGERQRQLAGGGKVFLHPLPAQIRLGATQYPTRRRICKRDPCLEVNHHQGAVDTLDHVFVESFEFPQSTAQGFGLGDIGKRKQNVTLTVQSLTAHIKD